MLGLKLNHISKRGPGWYQDMTYANNALLAMKHTEVHLNGVSMDLVSDHLIVTYWLHMAS